MSTATYTITLNSVDVTNDCKYVRYGRGKDNELDIPKTGYCEIRLNNQSKAYTPIYQALIKPNIPLTIAAAYTIPDSIPNPSFESGTTGWTLASNASVVTTDPYSGTKHLKVDVDAADKDSYNTLKYPVVEGQEVYLSAWIKAVDTPNQDIWLEIWYYDSGDNYLSEDHSTALKTTTTYTKHHTHGFAPHDATYCYFGVHMPATVSPTGSFYVDLFSNELVLSKSLFSGFVEEIAPHPEFSQRDVYITATDGIDRLASQKYKQVVLGTLGDLVTSCAEDVYPSVSKQLIDTGITVPLHAEDLIPFKDYIDKATRSEQGTHYVTGSGIFRWEDRNHRTSHTVSYVFNNTMTAITGVMNTKNIYNRITAIFDVWGLEDYQIVGENSELPEIAAGATKDVYIFYSKTPTLDDPIDIVYAALKSSDNTDYTANVSEEAQYPSANSVMITFKNNGAADCYLSLCQALGQPYSVLSQIQYQATDATSIIAYGYRELLLNNIYMADAYTGTPPTVVTTNQDFVDALLAKYKDCKMNDVRMTIVNKNDVLLQQILSREISDKVTIINTELELNADFYIESMDHEITEGGKYHKVVYGLSQA